MNNSPFDLYNLNDFVDRLGERHLVYTPSSVCPCKTDRSQADATCKMCNGAGYFWDDTRRVQIEGTIAAIKLTRNVLADGLVEDGDLILSQKTYLAPIVSVNDRIELATKFGEPWEGETVVRAGATTVLSYQPVVVQSLMGGDPRTGAVTRYRSYFLKDHVDPAAVPAAYDCYYQRGHRQLTWVAGKGPTEGGRTAITYRARLEYIAYETPPPRFMRGQNLGTMVMLKLKHRLLANIGDLTKGPEAPKAPDKAQRAFDRW